MKFFEKGQTLIELLLAMSLTAILLPVLIVSFTSSREGRAQESQRIGAVQLVKEAQEALRSVRERAWSEIATNGTYHPDTSGGTWILASGEETVNDFRRSIDIYDVYRDSNGAIVGLGGTLDPSTKRVVITVSWENPSQAQISSTFFVSRYENDVRVDTTEAEFNAGVIEGTVVTNTNGGEIILGAGGHANWCEPDVTETTLDLSGNGVAKGITAIEGFAFVGTGDNSSGLSFMKVNIGNQNPPIATLAGSFNGSKTNDVFGEQNYGYIATDTNSKEISIVNISTNPYSEIGYFDAPSNGNGESVYVLGNTGYMTTGTKLHNFDLSSKSGSRPIRDPDGVTLAGNANRVIVVGNYAYVAISGATNELQIVDVSNPTNMQVVGQANVTGVNGVDVFVNPTGTRAYLVTAVSATQREFFIIDVSTKTGNRPTLGSRDTSGMSPTAITVATGNRAIVVGTGGEEYQVIDITNEASPTRCGGAEVNVGINGISSVLEADSDAYSYILTNGDPEFHIIEGGPGGIYSDDGTFTSQALDLGNTVVLNRFTPDVVLAPTTTAQFQIAVADAVAGSCAGAGYTFVGPDGTSTTYFDSTGGPIPINDNGSAYENPGRCVKYRVFMTTGDYTATPIVNSVTVNYSL